MRPPRHRGLWVIAAAAIWAFAGVAMLTAPATSGGLARTARHVLRQASAHVLTRGPAHLLGPWPILIELLLAGALVTSVLAVRVLHRPWAPARDTFPEALPVARAIVDEHGDDSLSPFVLRPDKQLAFAAGGVLAYRVVRETVVVSGDPVGPAGSHAQLLARLLRRAHQAGCQVVLYGSSARHLAAYRELGLRALCVGEEAVVDPAGFTLEGRQVRKLRQSVHRVRRRGWGIEAREGRQIDAELEAEIDALEAAWRSQRGRILGFSMGMGAFDLGMRPADLYLLARSPEGELRAVMRFLAHRGRLSLDTMRRVGETPNGLNEALVCRALQVARSRGVGEVSLNYAGLAHLVHRAPSRRWWRRIAVRATIRLLGRRFQMDRLVLFNEKFLPTWRPRYLVYDSRVALPRSVLRVLQAEGHLRERRTLADRAVQLRHQLERLATSAGRIAARVGR